MLADPRDFPAAAPPADAASAIAWAAAARVSCTVFSACATTASISRRWLARSAPLAVRDPRGSTPPTTPSTAASLRSAPSVPTSASSSAILARSFAVDATSWVPATARAIPGRTPPRRAPSPRPSPAPSPRSTSPFFQSRASASSSAARRAADSSAASCAAASPPSPRRAPSSVAPSRPWPPSISRTPRRTSPPISSAAARADVGRLVVPAQRDRASPLASNSRIRSDLTRLTFSYELTRSASTSPAGARGRRPRSLSAAKPSGSSRRSDRRPGSSRGWARWRPRPRPRPSRPRWGAG